MKRVAIIGACGAGKSRLATLLGERLRLPVVHLDRLHWKPGWVEPTREEFTALQDEALPAEGSWIVDGNYGATMPLRLQRADTIVLLDLPTHVCLRRVIGRAWRDLGRVRPDMADGCPEQIFSRSYLQFLLYVARFRRDALPRALGHVAAHGRHATLHHLRSDREISRFLDGAGTSSTPARRG